MADALAGDQSERRGRDAATYGRPTELGDEWSDTVADGIFSRRMDTR
jgi:hypothetical protein